MATFGSSARIRAAALAAGVGLIGSLAFAAPGLGNPPPTGTNCTDKINGRGATFARNAHVVALIPGYEQDVCGPVADGNHASAMVLYNDLIAGENPLLPTWPLVRAIDGATTAPRVGSGAGVIGNKCRSDAFNMSDNPYTQAQIEITRLDPGAGETGDPAADAECAALSTGTAVKPPYEPQLPDTWPSAADVRAVSPVTENALNPQDPGADGQAAANGAMTFPITGAAIAMGINLTDAQCPGLAPGTRPNISLDNVMASRLFGGKITNWSSAELRPAAQPTVNTDLATCNFPVTRVVRFDSSGTTTQFKNYLQRARTTANASGDWCAPPVGITTTLWSQLISGTNNVRWPGDEGDPYDPNLSPAAQPASALPVGCEITNDVNNLIRGANRGGSFVVAGVAATAGAIGYADLENWQQGDGTYDLADVRANTTGNQYVPANSGSASSCLFPSGTPDSSSDTGYVGLGVTGAPAGARSGTANWSTNGTFSNITYPSGLNYPICAFTWAMVYGQSDVDSVPGQPISQMTANQRRTTYSYFLYASTPGAQVRLAQNGFAALSPSYQDRLRRGFSQHY